MRTPLIITLMFSSVAASSDCTFIETTGDFEHGIGDWELSGSAVVPDPLAPTNHVVALRGEPPAASAPVRIPISVDAVEIRFRVLAPTSLKLRFESKLLIRVRLYSEKGNSRFVEAEVTASGQWQMKSLRLSPVGEFRHRVLIEALNSDGPFYIDDFCVTTPEHNQAMQ